LRKKVSRIDCDVVKFAPVWPDPIISEKAFVAPVVSDNPSPSVAFGFAGRGSLSGKLGVVKKVCVSSTWATDRVGISIRVSPTPAAMKRGIKISLHVRECQEFRVRAGMMGRKEIPEGPTQRPHDS
jgi:hypothetical protein